MTTFIPPLIFAVPIFGTLVAHNPSSTGFANDFKISHSPILPKNTYSHFNAGKNKSATFQNGTKLICYFQLSNDFDLPLLQNLCTHIHAGFFEIDTQNFALDVSPEKLQILHQVVSLKKKANDLKVLIAIGGGGAKGFSLIVKVHKTRKKFIKNIMIFLKKNKIDGIDLDWEWPVLNGNAKEKIKFLQLLYEFRQEFMLHKKEFLLTVDVSSSRAISELAYNVHYMAKYVHYVIIMCYDYHYYTKWYPLTGHNSPLYSSPFDFDNNSVNSSIYFWISSTMPKEKMVLGAPTYGHTYRLSNTEKLGLNAPSNGVDTIGNNGFVSYPRICEFIKEKNTTVVWDDISKVPYAHQFPHWISFDNEQSLTLKATYAQEMKLGGLMIFSVNNDDYKGTCSQNGLRMPLVRKVRQILFNEV